MVTPLGQRLRQLRTSAGIAADELSERGGFSHSLVSHIETGQIANPGARTTARLAELLGASLDWLIAGAGSPPTVEQSRAAFDRHRQAPAQAS